MSCIVQTIMAFHLHTGFPSKQRKMELTDCGIFDCLYTWSVLTNREIPISIEDALNSATTRSFESTMK